MEGESEEEAPRKQRKVSSSSQPSSSSAQLTSSSSSRPYITTSAQRKSKASTPKSSPSINSGKKIGGRNYISNASSISKHLMQHYFGVLRDSKIVDKEALYNHTMQTLQGSGYYNSQLTKEVMNIVENELHSKQKPLESEQGKAIYEDIVNGHTTVEDLSLYQVQEYAGMTYGELIQAKESCNKKLMVLDYLVTKSDPSVKAFAMCLKDINTFHNQMTDLIVQSAGLEEDEA